jgi:tetratricopeptide (TPR) repeat protein
MSFEVQEPLDERGRSPASQLYEHARELMDGGAYEQAAEFFHQSAVESPHFKTYELLGECYIQLNRLTEAIPFLAAATALNRGVRAPSLLAEAWLSLGHYVEAAEAAGVALSREPNNKAALRVREAAAAIAKKRHEDEV